MYAAALHAHLAKLAAGIAANAPKSAAFDASYVFPHSHSNLMVPPTPSGVTQQVARHGPSGFIDIPPLTVPFAEDHLVIDRKALAAYASRVRFAQALEFRLQIKHPKSSSLHFHSWCHFFCLLLPPLSCVSSCHWVTATTSQPSFLTMLARYSGICLPLPDTSTGVWHPGAVTNLPGLAW